jgi:hypothetical protein
MGIRAVNSGDGTVVVPIPGTGGSDRKAVLIGALLKTEYKNRILSLSFKISTSVIEKGQKC